MVDLTLPPLRPAPSLPGFTHTLLTAWIAGYRRAMGDVPSYMLITPVQLEALYESMAARPKGVKHTFAQWKEFAERKRLSVMGVHVRIVEPFDGPAQ